MKQQSAVASTPLLPKGKPPLPEITSFKELPDFVTDRSILFFERFCPGYETWMEANLPWDGIPEYEMAKALVRSIVPVNDPAERLCGLAKRYKVDNFQQQAVKPLIQ